MAMEPTTEQLLLTRVAEIGAYQKANHDEQQRTNNRVADELSRLATVNEQREAAQQQREGLLQQQINQITHWQLTHPHEPHAHPEMATLLSSNAEVINDHEVRLQGLETVRDANAERAKGRREVWGLQKNGLLLVVGIASSPIVAGAIAYFAGVFG